MTENDKKEMIGTRLIEMIEKMDKPTQRNASCIKICLERIKKEPITLYEAISQAKKATNLIMGAKIA